MLLDDVSRPPLAADFAREERSGLTTMFWGRVIVLSLLAIWVLATLPLERSSAYFVVIVIFLMSGAIPYALVQRGYGGTLLIALFLLIDASVLSYLLIVPNPFGLEGWSPQMNLRTPGFLYLGVFLTYMSLSYKPALVVWAGLSAVISWSVGYWWVVMQPDTQVFSSQDVLDANLSLDDALAVVLDPQAVGISRWANQVFFLLAVTLILTLTVWRSRQLVQRQVAAESERSALSRYFSPNIVQELTRNRTSLDQPKVQRVAVLFADMVGFTAISERLEPLELLELLREFHGRLARTAIQNGGTIDKYIGDAIMVHFGTPDPREDDPVRALRCAGDMISEIDAWNTSRAADQLDPIRIGIGLHYGNVVVGNIGSETRLEYTILGETVNIASRLETLTRKLGSTLVASEPLVQAVRDRGIDPTALVQSLEQQPPEILRGITTPLQLWTTRPHRPDQAVAGAALPRSK